MRSVLISVLLVSLLPACGREEPKKAAEPDPRDKALYEAVKKPLDQAKALEDTLEAQKKKMDDTIDAETSKDQ